MINRAKEIALLSIVGFILLVVGVAIFSNLRGFESAVSEFVAEIWIGAKMLFFTALGLGVIGGLVKIRQMSKVRVIGPSKHGPAQALVVKERKGVQRVEHLQNPALDPREQLQVLEQIMKLAGTQAMTDQRILAALAKQQRAVVPYVEPPQEEPQDELPTNVRYEEVRNQVPKGHILVGIGRKGLDTVAKAVGALIWIVGLSGTGKTSTTVLRVEERASDGHKFLGVDPHWFKSDSLYHAIYELADEETGEVIGPGPYAGRFLRPMARTPKEGLAVLHHFLGEFNGRKSGRIPKPWQKITLLYDEVSAAMDPTAPKGTEERAQEEEIAQLLPTIARICGQEARNFEMGGILISQQATGLAWLRKVALMVIVHQLLMESEKKLACNGDTEAMQDMKTWPIGRTYVYGVGFADGPRTVQQPYFGGPKNDSPATYPDGPYVEADNSFPRMQGRNTGPLYEAPTDDVDALADTVPDTPLQGAPMLGPNDWRFDAEQEAEFLRRYRKKPQAVKDILRQMNHGQGLSNRYAKYAGWLLEREGLRG